MGLELSRYAVDGASYPTLAADDDCGGIDMNIRAKGFIDSFLIESVNFVSMLFGSPIHLVHSMVGPA
jgi:hypothetical protein